jgi:ABC-type lipoprotein export system ATPase subunit
MALFQELGRSGITIVLVTHEPDIAAFASRVIVVRDGRVITDERRVPLVADPAAAAAAQESANAALIASDAAAAAAAAVAAPPGDPS